MKVTDEQYNQVFRYVDGQMEDVERKEFEVMLAQRIELREELEIYKELRSLSNSIEQKISNTNLYPIDEKTGSDKEVFSLIDQARENWEKKHENDLRLKHGITAIEESDNKIKDFDNIGGINNLHPELDNATPIVRPSGEEKGLVKRMNPWKWVAAAVFIGFISSGLFWWYSQDDGKDANIALKNKKTDSQVVDKKKIDSSEKINPPKPLPQENAPPKNIAKKEKANGQPLKTDKPGIDRMQREALFAANFKPEAAPAVTHGLLEEAFDNYKNGDYKNASHEYEDVIAVANQTQRAPDSKKEEAERKSLLFYAHYYNALSYMAANNPEKAIAQLEAIKEAPDAIWQSKAKWYLGLAYLKTGEVKKAGALLKQVADSKQAGDYSLKAVRLINELESNNGLE